MNKKYTYQSLSFLLLLCFSLFSASGCKGDKKQQDSPYPTLDNDTVIRLYNRCNQLDLIFHKESFSLSMTTEESIKAMVSFISTQPVRSLPKNCTNAARATFIINGNIDIEADVHLGPDDNCNYFLFVDDQNKPKYANKMSPQGIKYFENLFQQASKVDPNKRR